ncbi:MAG: hypothetical protein KAJ31_06440 [Deltaproteobacteria bacterium]|nr:hypothetical protein [Deltaproteobacteria bacterium]MCK5711038.1 hypothetical protein [Deltaproteobacteria bacterium]
MQKIIFSTFAVAAFIIVTNAFSYSADGYDQNKLKLIPGSNKAAVAQCTDGSTVYSYENYEIHTKPSEDFVGNNIKIYKSNPEVSDPCTSDHTKPYYYIKAGEFGGANTIAGLYGNLLFLDQWTGRDYKRLLAINMDTKSLVFFDTYAEPEIRAGKLNYFRTLKTKRQSVKDKIPCPEAEKWQSDGKQVLYVEKMSVDLSTMKKEPSGEFSCMPVDPIGTAAPKRYGH